MFPAWRRKCPRTNAYNHAYITVKGRQGPPTPPYSALASRLTVFIQDTPRKERQIGGRGKVGGGGRRSKMIT